MGLCEHGVTSVLSGDLAPSPVLSGTGIPHGGPWHKSRNGPYTALGCQNFRGGTGRPREAADAPVSHAYLHALAEEVLGSSYPDIQAADRLFAACAPLQNAVEASTSPEEFFPALEKELAGPSGQDVQKFLEISSDK